jgi:hypothetical protein
MTSQNISLPKKGFSFFKKQPVKVQARRIKRTIQIKTLEGTMTGNPGDWLIIGVNGEKYPCKHEIFMQTYCPTGDSKCNFCAFGKAHMERHEGPCDMHETCLFEWAGNSVGISGGEAME